MLQLAPLFGDGDALVGAIRVPNPTCFTLVSLSLGLFVNGIIREVSSRELGHLGKGGIASDVM